MSLFSILAVEVLEWITGVLSAESMARLWITGDRNLQFKLANGGVSTFRLSWSQAGYIPWPKLLFRLPKRLDTISWNARCYFPYCPDLDLTLVPPTLTCLRLRSVDVFCVLNASNCKLDALFPLLTMLDLEGDRITVQNMKNLPPNLTSLQFTSYSCSLTSPTIFGDLPRHLKKICLYLTVKDPMEFENALPSELEDLRISCVEANYDWLTKLPQSLHCLSLRIFAPVKWESLPSQLRTLTISNGSSNVGSLELSKLPHTLTKLDIPISEVSDVIIKQLPPLVRSIGPGFGELSHDALSCLPNTVVDVDTAVIVTHTDMFSLFHPDTEGITLIDWRYDPSVSERLNPLPLPSKLVSLQLPYITDAICQILPPTLAELTAEGGEITELGAKRFSCLSLIYVALSIYSLTDEVMPYLRHVKYLYLGDNSPGKGLKVTENFLHRLLSSSPEYLPNDTVSEFNALDLTSSPKETASNIKIIPKSDHEIDTLSVTFDDGDEGHLVLPDHIFPAFSFLPYLKNLYISSNSSRFDPSLFRHLPRTLQHLGLGLLASYPTTQHFDMLPPSLTKLRLEVRNGEPHRSFYENDFHCPWTDSDLAHLPRTLHTLQINGSPTHITSALHDYTPPYLSEMTFNWAKLSAFQTPLVRRFGP